MTDSQLQTEARPSLAELEQAAQLVLQQQQQQQQRKALHEASTQHASCSTDAADVAAHARHSNKALAHSIAAVQRAERYAAMLDAMDALDTHKSAHTAATTTTASSAAMSAAMTTTSSCDDVETIDLTQCTATSSGRLVAFFARGVTHDTTRYDNYLVTHNVNDDDVDDDGATATPCMYNAAAPPRDEETQQLCELPPLEQVLCLDDVSDGSAHNGDVQDDDVAARPLSHVHVAPQHDVDDSDGSDDDVDVTLPGLECDGDEDGDEDDNSSNSAGGDGVAAVVTSNAAAATTQSSAVVHAVAQCEADDTRQHTPAPLRDHDERKKQQQQKLRDELRALAVEVDDGVYTFALDPLHDYDADVLGLALRTHGYAARV